MALLRQNKSARYWESHGRVYRVVLAVCLLYMAHELSDLVSQCCGATFWLVAVLTEIDLVALCVLLFLWTGSATAFGRDCQVIPCKGFNLFSLGVDHLCELAVDDLNSSELAYTSLVANERLASERRQQRKRGQSRPEQLRKEFHSMIEVAESLVANTVEEESEPHEAACDLHSPAGGAEHCGRGSWTKLPLYVPSTIHNYHAVSPLGLILPSEAAATQYEPEISGHLRRLLEDRVAVLEVRSIGLWLPAIPE